MRTIKYWLALSACVLCVWCPGRAEASVSADMPHICPLNGERFMAMVPESASFVITRLDFRQVGSAVSPWPMVTCPGNGFPLFEKTFSPEELAKLKAFAETAEYQTLRKDHPVYYLVARLQRLLNRPLDYIATSMVYASWQSEPDEQRARTYLAEALPLFQEFLEQSPPADAKSAAKLRFLTVELHRRLGWFEQAAALLQQHRDQIATVIPPAYMDLEALLIRQQKSAPAAPGMPDSKVP